MLAGAQAGVLYWQVAPAVAYEGSSEALSYSYAKIKIEEGNKYLTSYIPGSSGSDTLGETVNADSFGKVAIGAVFDGSYSDQTFVIELFDSQDQLIGWASSTGVSDLSNYIQDQAEFGSSWNMMNSWKVAQVVPEPTSGMLLMLGAALLALKRRKVA